MGSQNIPPLRYEFYVTRHKSGPERTFRHIPGLGLHGLPLAGNKSAGTRVTPLETIERLPCHQILKSTNPAAAR